MSNMSKNQWVYLRNALKKLIASDASSNQFIKKQLTAKKLLPPIFFHIKQRLFPFLNMKLMSSESFINWWVNYSHASSPYKEKSIPDLYPELVSMVNDFVKTESFKNTSELWKYLAKCHIELLYEHGIGNFKQTIGSHSYEGMLSPDSILLEPIINDKISILVDSNQIFKKHDYYTLKDSIGFNIGTFMMLNYVINNCKIPLELVEESSFGNPTCVNYSGYSIAPAVLYSIMEIEFIMKHIEIPKNSTILEIGAGSGRVCISMLKVIDTINKYIIVDIPPALYISQCAVIHNFPEKRIFKFRPFLSFAEHKEEYDSADVVFISLEQLQFLPENSVHLSIAIDCLHEMEFDMIEQYFNHFDRLSKFLYFKCQIEQWAKTSKINLEMDNYPVKEHWYELKKEKCCIPNTYFHAIYALEFDYLKNHDDHLVGEETSLN